VEKREKWSLRRLIRKWEVNMKLDIREIDFIYLLFDRLCGLVVSIADYKHRGPGFDFWALLRIFLRELVLEQGPLSLVFG
jgi:hypothetical protein